MNKDMTTELEIDKDEFDAFVRESLNLSPDAALTDFQYGEVQDKIANHEVDLMTWLEKRRAAAAASATPPGDVKAPKFPPPGAAMKDLPPPPSSPQPPKQPAGPAATPAGPKPAGAFTPAPAPARPAPVKKVVQTPAPAANRTPVRSHRSRHIGPKKGGIGIFSTLITLILLAVTVVMAIPAYMSLEKREEMAKADWMKSVPPEMVQSLLFRGQKSESSPSLQFDTPIQVLAFASKKPFRADGSLRLGTPVTDTVQVRVEIVSATGMDNFHKILEFKAGKQEVEFETRMPAGDYQVRLTLESDMSVDKLPSNFDVAIRF